MPLIEDIIQDELTRIVVWEVSETNEELLSFLQLNEKRVQKYQSLKPKQAREYLGLRACLKTLGLDYDINYNEKGKPFLPTGKHISITHSYGKVSIGLSKYEIGVDIELRRPQKIINIFRKFIREDEAKWLPKSKELPDYLHIIWGIKEGLYKINGGNLWNFLHHYRVPKFILLQDKPIECWIIDEVQSRKYYAFVKKVDDSFLIWVLDYLP